MSQPATTKSADHMGLKKSSSRPMGPRILYLKQNQTRAGSCRSFNGSTQINSLTEARPAAMMLVVLCRVVIEIVRRAIAERGVTAPC